MLWEVGEYLILMAPIVVEGSCNKSTPHQLGVAMLYLKDRNEPALLQPGDPRSTSRTGTEKPQEAYVKPQVKLGSLVEMPFTLRTTRTSPSTARGHNTVCCVTPTHPHATFHKEINQANQMACPRSVNAGRTRWSAELEL